MAVADLIELPRPHPAWDSFWRYDRLSSFHAAPGAPNYGFPIADGWRMFFARLPDGAHVLDLATGNGAIAVMAVEADKGFAVTGADLATIEPCAFVTQSRAALEQVQFLPNTPAEALPLPDASIDAVVSQYGVEYSDLTRSVPEAARVLAPRGRLRFAVHAAEGAIVRDTKRSITDANFLIELDLIGLARQCATALDVFNAGLRAIADRVPTATDQPMLVNVHQTLCDTYDLHRVDLLATATHLSNEIIAHRDRQAALVASAQSESAMAELADMLRQCGLSDVTLGHQRGEHGVVGHVIEAANLP